MSENQITTVQLSEQEFVKEGIYTFYEGENFYLSN